MILKWISEIIGLRWLFPALFRVSILMFWPNSSGTYTGGLVVVCELVAEVLRDETVSVVLALVLMLLTVAVVLALVLILLTVALVLAVVD